jgi:signal transduction histidine kinase/ligand-binding sensor domain-containing protein
LWIGTINGLNIFHGKTGKFSHYTFNAKDPGSISNNYITKIYEDKEGTIWIGTWGNSMPGDNTKQNEGGLNRYARKNENFIRYFHDPKDTSSLLENNIATFFEDSRGVFWVGTEGDGLHIMNRKKGTFQRLSYDAANPSKLSMPHLKSKLTDAKISFINEDASGAIWIGAFYGGVNRYDPKTQELTHFEFNPELKDAGSFRLTYPAISFTSSDNVFWIGTGGYIGGYLYHLDPFHQNIPSYNLYMTDSRRGMTEAAPGVLMTADINNGVIRITESTWSFKEYYNHPDDSTSISSTSVQCVTKDRNGIVWIGTDGGLNRFDMNTQKFRSFRHDSANSHSLSNDLVTAVFEDGNNNLWVGTWEGIDKFDRNTGFFTHYAYHPKDTTGNGFRYTAKSISVDSGNNLWIGTDGSGVYKIDIKTGKYNNYFKNTYIAATYVDADNRIWVGTKEGLFLFDVKADEFAHFQENAVSIITDVAFILEDNEKNLWISASNGILRIDERRARVSLYANDFGIRQNSFSDWGCKALDGKLFFATDSGFIAFYPEQLTVNSKPPLINLDNFRLGDRIVKVSNNGPLVQSLSEMKEMRLNYDQNIFSFDIAVLDFTNPDENQVFFTLEGYETTWHPAGSDQRAYYFNIPPDKYTFRVKAANSYGVWAEKDLIIIISPPWWETWWFRIFSVIAMIAVVYAIVQKQSRNLKKQNIVLEEKVMQRTKELKHSLEELKQTQAHLVQSEKMASLGDLTAGIAHEIQNPLNFVNNFSDVNTELIDELEQEVDRGNLNEVKAIAKDIKDNEQKINHHGKRADAIVKGMLQHSRASTGQKEPTRINALADEYLRLAYHGLRAKDKSFNAEMKTYFDVSIDNIDIIPQDIGRVLLNLYNNAFYAVNEKKEKQAENYEPTVSVFTKKSNGKVEISVKDNGNGIPQKVVEKIFQPFFTTKPTGQGTGLGLSLSYDIIKAHGGEIKVETKGGEGTTFIIQLPVS